MARRGIVCTARLRRERGGGGRCAASAPADEFVDLRARSEALDADALPVRPLTWGRVPGRSGELVLAT